MEEPRNARSRRTRTAVLDAARLLIESEGFGALTMSRVADVAGVSRQAVYLHAGSRAELVSLLFRHVNEQEGLAASVEAVWSTPDGAACLEQWARHVARFQPRVSAILRANDEVRRTDPDADALWRLVMRDWMAACRRLSGRLADEGLLAPPWDRNTAAEMLWALMSYDVVDRLTREKRWSQRRLGDHLAALMTRTFLVDEAS